MGIKLGMFANEAEPRVCQAGDVIFGAFDMGAEMYVVLEGEIELSIDSKVIETLGPGEPFGEMALIDQSPRAANALAETDCALLAMNRKVFLSLVKSEPAFGIALLSATAERLRNTAAALN
jgi:CRP/FNR family cyclic AMP-dependent transcriptional regulator